MANINELINGHEIESASPLAHAVRYDRVQVKNDQQKQQARSNMGAAAAADLTTQTGRITKAMHMIAPDYSATSTYAVGDLVVRGDKLYKCSTAIETAEAWTAAHWTETTVAEAGVGGGGGSSSGGGGVSIVGQTRTDSSVALDKTAAEIIEMAETSIIFLSFDEDVGEGVTYTHFDFLSNIQDLRAVGEGVHFCFYGDVPLTYAVSDLDEYPSYDDNNGGGVL